MAIISKIRFDSRMFLKIGLLIAFLLVAPLFGSSYINHLLIVSLMWGTLASAYDLSLGYMGLVNWGYAGFISLGAYTSALMMIRLGLPVWITMLLGGVMSAFIGFLTGILTLRLRGFYVVMFTWFVGEAITFIGLAWVEVTRGLLGLMVPPIPNIAVGNFTINWTANRLPYYYLILGLSIIILVIMYLIVQSKIGLAWRAIREDEVAAEMLGVNTINYKLLNLTLSCFFAGILGSFYAHYIGILVPTDFTSALTLEILTFTYVGGRATLFWPILGAGVLIFMSEIFRPLLVLRLVIYGVLLILTMIAFPKGLSGLKDQIISFISR